MARFKRQPGDLVVVTEVDDSLRHHGVRVGDLGMVIHLDTISDLGIAFETCEYDDWYVDWHGFKDWDGPVPDELLARAVKARLAYALRATNG